MTRLHYPTNPNSKVYFQVETKCRKSAGRQSLTSTTFAYKKLPQRNFKLSVIKLNGSCFDVEVGVMATVGELKQAVEYVFNHCQQNRDPYISWSHVWGHFCLCYEGQKLNDDKEHIRYLGIRDGDKLYFGRRLAMNYKLDKRLTKDGSGDNYKHIYIRILDG